VDLLLRIKEFFALLSKKGKNKGKSGRKGRGKVTNNLLDKVVRSLVSPAPQRFGNFHLLNADHARYHYLLAN
jgi:hypothetical protein